MTVSDLDKTDSAATEIPQESAETARPISWTALLALLAGLASPLVLWSSCFLLLPLAAVLLGAAALWQTYDVDPVPIGRRAAWVGMFLGLFVASSAVTYHAVRVTREEVQVDALLEQFLSYLSQGEAAKAFELTRSPLFRADSPRQVDARYRDNQAHRQSLKTFQSDMTVEFLLTARRMEILESLTFAQLEENDRVFLHRHYKLRILTQEGKEKVVDMKVVFARRADSRGVGAWWIHEFDIPPDQLF